MQLATYIHWLSAMNFEVDVSDGIASILLLVPGSVLGAGVY